MVKNHDLGLENAGLGLRPQAVFSRPRSQFFTIRTSHPANNIYFLTENNEEKIGLHRVLWFQFELPSHSVLTYRFSFDRCLEKSWTKCKGAHRMQCCGVTCLYHYSMKHGPPFETTVQSDFMSEVLSPENWWGWGPDKLSRLEIESEQFKYFAVNLLVAQNKSGSFCFVLFFKPHSARLLASFIIYYEIDRR